MSDVSVTENVQTFLQQINIFNKASIGVVLVKTREPLRVKTVLKEFAGHTKMPFLAWNNVDGWEMDVPNQKSPKKIENTVDPVAALKHVGETDGKNHYEDGGIFTMMYPHFYLADGGKVKHPVMVQILKEFVVEFSGCKKRLFLIVPQEFSVPHELEDDLTIIDFDTPAEAERTALFHRLMDHVPPEKRPKFSKEDLKAINAITAGMTAHEVQNALARALAENRAELPNVPVSKIINVLAGIKTEAIRRSEVLELVPAENMANVGGLDNLKSWLNKRVNCFTEEAKKEGVDTPKGIALIGPPGTGKSLFAKSVADTLRLPLIRFDVSRVFNSLVGSSESRVRGALKMVDSLSPCVLMIDEVDKVFQSNSGGGDSGVGQRVLGALLTWMNDTTSPVFMVVTANRVNNLPAEFLRKGRLDEVFSVSVPSSEERLEIVKIHLKKRGKDVDSVKNLDAAVVRSEGYVPAEIESAVKEAILESFACKIELTGELIAEQLGNMKPLSESFKEDFDMMNEWAINNARSASSKKDNVAPPVPHDSTIRNGLNLDD